MEQFNLALEGLRKLEQVGQDAVCLHALMGA
jgi:hypothetical protein